MALLRWRPVPLSTDWPEGVGRQVLAEVDSTNAEALRQAPRLSGPEWILALRQTSGRGRRGRAWVDPPGNFAASLITRPKGPAEQVALLSFVAALSVFDALSAVCGRVQGLALKWPNDVLLNGGKVAGILLESVGQGGALEHVAVGIGVNLRHAPEVGEVEADALRPVSLLSETGADVTPEEFLEFLAPSFADWERQFETYGFEPIREAWLTRAARLGETVTARAAGKSVVGRFETLDAGGRLVLSTPEGRTAITAAEVFF